MEIAPEGKSLQSHQVLAITAALIIVPMVLLVCPATGNCIFRALTDSRDVLQRHRHQFNEIPATANNFRRPE